MEITRAEFVQRCQEGELWICIDEKVYDVSQWAPSHPGGYTILAETSGTDVSAIFHAFHVSHGSSSKALGILQHLRQVATLRDPESKLKDSFHTLRETISREGLYHTDYVFYYQLALWLGILYMMAVYFAVTAENTTSATIAGICMGLFFQQCAFVGHDAGHCAITHDRKTDALIGTIAGPLLTVIPCIHCKSQLNS
jgi:cytochrome b involved in lipid metabolism